MWSERLCFRTNHSFTSPVSMFATVTSVLHLPVISLERRHVIDSLLGKSTQLPQLRHGSFSVRRVLFNISSVPSSIYNLNSRHLHATIDLQVFIFNSVKAAYFANIVEQDKVIAK